MSNTYRGNTEKKGTVRKVISVIAAVLAVLIVAGVLISYNIATSGFVQRHTAAVESDNYSVSGAMMTYLFNAGYQNYVSSANAYGYLSMTGLDTTKDLKSQMTGDGSSTWYDYFLKSASNSAEQMLVLCEAAKADGFTVDGLDDEIDEAVQSMKDAAAQYNVTFDYYLKTVYGSSVNEKVLRQYLEMSEIASHYSQHMNEQYSFEEADWQKYFEDNKDSFVKVDWMLYSFTAEAKTLGDDATDEEKAAATEKRKEDYEALKAYAEELKATADADAFKAYVENYLRTVKYADLDEEAMKEDNIDINADIEKLTQTGNAKSGDSDQTKWAFDDVRKAYDTFSVEKEDSFTIEVYMLLPAENSEDLGFACKYRDTYNLQNYRVISVLNSSYDNDADEAKSAADTIWDEYSEDATEDNFAALASADKYGDGTYEGGLRENADKGAVNSAVDEWVYSSERKAGDCELIAVDGTGYYIVYYVGEGDVKWQNNADSALKSEKYSEEYEELADKYEVSEHAKGMKMISVVDLGAAASSGNSAS